MVNALDTEHFRKDFNNFFHKRLLLAAVQGKGAVRRNQSARAFSQPASVFEEAFSKKLLYVSLNLFVHLRNLVYAERASKGAQSVDHFMILGLLIMTLQRAELAILLFLRGWH